jgi:hypothetical protein
MEDADVSDGRECEVFKNMILGLLYNSKQNKKK